MLVIVLCSNAMRLVINQVTKVCQYFKRKEWKFIISKCRARGMTVKVCGNIYITCGYIDMMKSIDVLPNCKMFRFMSLLRRH